MKKLGLIVTFCTFLCVGAGTAWANSEVIGHVRTAEGETRLVRDETRQAANIGDEVYLRDVIETGADGAIGITFIDNSVFSAGPNSSIVLEQFEFDSAEFKGNLLARMDRGTLSVVSGDIARTSPEAMKIKTPTAILGVRGTTFLVRVSVISSSINLPNQPSQSTTHSYGGISRPGVQIRCRLRVNG